ncbi:MAG TPA: hypothetical protein VFL62_22865 [Bradyrhizobium sp.]|uniref:hypothetical protein n=1 Tax=Bradyrhizobium sp. TaxID=376 RepID=UPI002D8043CA|nr:hypothetical protein [Bradyrhizobium sp.]HET7889080.1 hypothetical protein [Bradyrhizobium sp.]
MSDATLPSKAIADSEALSFQRKTRRRGFLTALVEALHHSRRLEAQRILRRYRHLIDAKDRERILKGIEDVPE